MGEEGIDISNYFNSHELPDSLIILHGLKEYAEEQGTAKGYLFLAYLNMINRESDELFQHNINTAFELGGPEYGLAHYVTAYYYSIYHPNHINDDKVIFHGKLALNANINEFKKKTLKFIIYRAYENKGDYNEACKYYIERMNPNDFDGPIGIESFRQLSGIDLYNLYMIYKDKFIDHVSLNPIAKVCQVIEKKDEENRRLQRENETLRAFPGGPDYIEALANFNELSKK